jgi:hypothetical protein
VRISSQEAAKTINQTQRLLNDVDTVITTAAKTHDPVERRRCAFIAATTLRVVHSSLGGSVWEWDVRRLNKKLARVMYPDLPKPLDEAQMLLDEED